MRTEEQIKEAFSEQMMALRASAKAFDEGAKWEAKRLATVIHILVHDAGRTTSLLTQMGLKSNLQFVSTATPIVEDNLIADMPLVWMRMGDSVCEYVPSFVVKPKSNLRAVSFTTWIEEPAYRAVNQLPLSRKNLILSLRDQDGGAHFDQSLGDPAYRSVATENSAGWVFRSIDGQDRIPIGPHLASMRQIAWEMDETVKTLGY